jgi:hypothetical protein
MRDRRQSRLLPAAAGRSACEERPTDLRRTRPGALRLARRRRSLDDRSQDPTRDLPRNRLMDYLHVQMVVRYRHGHVQPQAERLDGRDDGCLVTYPGQTPVKGAAPKSVLTLAAIVAVIAFVYFRTNLIHVTHGAAKDESASITADIGASSCSSSGYEITSKLNDSKQTIYDCLMPSGNYKCVTRENNINSDSTAVVRLLFANVLGSAKPTCIA